MGSKEQKRIESHPILSVKTDRKKVQFTFNGLEYTGFEGEMISSALFANGIKIFGHHPKDGSPQGIFCANGQCAQCTVLVNGVPLKSCMTALEGGMIIESLDNYPQLPDVENLPKIDSVPTFEIEVLILGAGPAGISAALELAANDINVLLVDDKNQLGGKLVLQTHKFFGSVEDSYAGTRGTEIAKILEKKVNDSPNIETWLESTAIGIFSDQVVGVLKKDKYILVKPEKLLIATGAREKMLVFPGNTLPGVYGAGAFQTLVNRDLIKASDRIFIVGGGNVGLIAGYHAIQAGIEVVGLVEALPECGGYKVHEDKLRRLGVPIYTQHTIIAAHGDEHVESLTISAIDENFSPVKGAEKTYAVDTILIAIGLDPVNEFCEKAREFNMDVWSAGDANEIAEASSAMFSGKIVGIEIAKSLGKDLKIPKEWQEKSRILKSEPGPVEEREPELLEEDIFPVIHCKQKIPCNPCTSVCREGKIQIGDDNILGLPKYEGKKDLVTYYSECIGCGYCVAACPGLAITLIDRRNDWDNPFVTLPFEIKGKEISKGDSYILVDEEGKELGKYEVKKVRRIHDYPKTQLVSFQMAKDSAIKATSIKIQDEEKIESIDLYQEIIPDDAIICRCERVTAGELRSLIKKGIVDMNQIKALTKAGMGSCGGKTCTKLIERLFREENIQQDKVTTFTKRPLFIEVSLKHFLGSEDEEV